MASRDEATDFIPPTVNPPTQNLPHAASTKSADDATESTSPTDLPTSTHPRTEQQNDPSTTATNTHTTTLVSPLEMSQLDSPTSPTTPGLNDRFISASSSLTNLQETQATGGAAAAGVDATPNGTNDSAASHTRDGGQSLQPGNDGTTTATTAGATNTAMTSTQQKSESSPIHPTPQSNYRAPLVSTAEDPEDTLSSTAQPPPPQLSGNQRQQSSAGIGPSEDNPQIVPDPNVAGPAVLITLLLTTGARHPYRIDKKYLRKRMSVEEGDEPPDPFEISIYAVKELIWRDWREEWEPRPATPTSIRLIHFGKLLDDKSVLKDHKLQPSTPNIIHMTVKPDTQDDEEGGHGKKTLGIGRRHRGGAGAGGGGAGGEGDDEEGRGSGCCRCCVM
ncbi:MAG: hypothetical protein M1831_001695 [Alyxoria varia]|nr:MAG: hypothetical protein M1831_001695 [Alyxoria varia]